jgi:sugar O-acyltransferase (sialic acid O-acetyltransferase NeuD family)
MDIIIFGSGGHSLVIIDILNIYKYNILGIYDDYKSHSNSNIKIIDKIQNGGDYLSMNAICAIGDNKIRENIINYVDNITNYKISWITLIHPFSFISENVIIGKGTIINAGVVIQTNVNIGKHSIINTNSSIDHECIIHNFVHIAPNCALCGNVQIYNNVLIGVGCNIIPNIIINKNSIIGAGSTVLKNVKNDTCVYGIIK